MIQYKMFDHGAVLVTRRGMLFDKDKETEVTFDGAPNGSVAIFKTNDGRSFFRKLEEQTCRLKPTEFREGEVSVHLTIPDQSARPRRIGCEGLTVSAVAGTNTVLVLPNDDNLPARVAALLVENSEIREEMRRIYEKLNATNTRIDTLLEGYDIT
jgi:hypothetical protein